VSNHASKARVAGRLVARWLPAAKQSGQAAAKQWVPGARQSGLFIKHVLPAALKPIHSLWHEVLGFIFLALAAVVGWGLWRRPGRLEPMQFILVVVFIAVMAGYGISSILKSRRISRS
jgi:hypothetical protein